MSGIIGRKVGITRVFGDDGRSTTVTVVEAGPCTVSQIKTREKDGYSAIQLGFESKREKNAIKPEVAHFKKAGVGPKRIVREFRCFPEDAELSLGDEIKVDSFVEGDRITVAGWAKGKGFQGVMRRHGFGGGPKTHGQSDRPRSPGSIGQASYPARVFKGLRMAGRTGGQKVTLKHRKIVQIIPEKNLILIEGTVPGSKSGLLIIQK